jgi:hypothetical protein
MNITKITLNKALELVDNDKYFDSNFDYYMATHGIGHDRCHEHIPDWAWTEFVEEYFNVEIVEG